MLPMSRSLESFIFLVLALLVIIGEAAMVWLSFLTE
jgi:hypothetical protein